MRTSHGSPGARAPEQRKRDRASAVNRAKALFMSVVLTLSQVLGMVGSGLTAEVASAATVGEQLSLSEATLAVGRTYTFKLSNGQLAWCGDRHANHPEVGRPGTVIDGGAAHWHYVRGDDSTLTGYSETQQRMIDYLVYVGNRDVSASNTAWGMYGVWTDNDASKAAVVVQAAIWMVSAYDTDDVTLDGECNWNFYAGDGYGQTSDVYSRDCILRAYNEAKAYALGGAGNPEIDHCATAVRFGNDVQDIFFYTAPTGSVTLKKTSANPSITDGNACYSLSGAKYDVFSDAACTVKVGDLTTDLAGNTGTLTGLAAGTYYAKETQASEGYRLCGDVHQVTVAAGRTATFTCEEEPADDPVSMLVGKYDPETEKTYTANNLPNGSASLAGAEFTVEYYATLDYGSYEALKASGAKPTRSWVFSTDEDGYAYFSEQYFVSGDAVYKSAAGAMTIPRGTVVIRETKASEGYKVNSDFVSFQKIKEDAATSAAITYNAPTVEEPGIRGGVAATKIDHDRDASVAQGDATLAGAEISVYNASEGPVYIDGKKYEVGDKIEGVTLVTDKDGKASTASNALPYGEYTLKETKAPKGYRLNEKWSVTLAVHKDGVIVEAPKNLLPDDVQSGAIELDKVDYDLYKDYSQGDANLPGAKIAVKNVSAAAVEVNGKWYQPGDVVMTLTVDDECKASTGAEALPYGTYELYEVATGEGYKLNKDWKETVELHQDKVTKHLDAAIANKVERGGVRVRKYDAGTGDAAQGDATLEGAEFQIKNISQNSVYVDGVLYTNGQVVKTISTKVETDSDGNSYYVAATADDALPYGTYEIREVRPSDGYDNNDEWSEVFEIRADKQVADLTIKDKACPDKVILGGLKVRKVDLELMAGEALGAATLEGCEVTVKNVSAAAVEVNGVLYRPGEDVMTLTSDAEGNFPDTGYTLPYGTYEVRETRAPIGYTLDEDWTRTVEVREHKIYDLTGEKDAVANQVIRGDIRLVKADEDSQSRMAGVAFTLTSKTTGETHVLVTDENGVIDTSSSFTAHSSSTNASDAALATDGTLDESKLDASAGVWFSGTTEKATDPNDEVGALPYDTYVLQELRCSKNAGHRLVSAEVTVSRHGYEIDLGTFDDKEVHITTELSYEGGHEVPQASTVTLTDKVSYENLAAHANYTLKGELHLVDDKGADQGVVATSEQAFQTDMQSSSTEVFFTIDTSVLKAGYKLVAFEELSERGDWLAEHKELSDEGQTVTVKAPEISTTAVDAFDGDKNVVAEGGVSVTDTVHYKFLVPGNEYTVSGTLVNKSDGKAFTDAEGREVKASATFVPESSEGDVDVTFTFDASGVADDTRLVAFEELAVGGTVVAEHKDTDDESQTVTVKKPVVGTTAADALDGDKYVTGEADVTVVDKVHYSGVTTGKTYKVRGTLMNKATGKAFLDAAGNEVTSEAEFCAEDTYGDAEVTFTFDASSLSKGDKLVVFEDLMLNGKVIADHSELGDEGQTVEITKPELATTATDGFDGDSVITGEGDVTLVDTVSYSGVTPGKTYKVTGTLMDKATGEAVKGADGKAVTSEAEFIPRDTYGEVKVLFTFDASSFKAGDKVVAFEKLWTSGSFLAGHEDIEDEGQTVTVAKPELKTTATDASDGDKFVVGEADVAVTDKVHYKGVTTGKTYKLTGTLMNAATGEAVTDADGNPVTAEAEFEAEDTHGDAEMTFTFDASAFKAGDKLVVFESLSYKGTEIADHADLGDEGQTVTVTKPELGTTAVDAFDGDKNVVGEGNVSVTDTVHYKGVTPGKTYKVTGTLVNKATGEAVTDAEGNPVTSEAEFIAEDTHGDVKVTFTFDAYEYKAGDKLVAFETLSHKGAELTTHADIDDESQTVEVTKPELKTQATDGVDGDKNVIGEADAVVVDTVHYKGLTPGKTYKMVGTLMNKATGEAVTDADGNPVTAETDFTAESVNGDVTVTFTFDGSSIPAGEELVAFESVTHNGIEIGAHADIEDEDQTTEVIKPKLSTTAVDAYDGDKNVVAEGGVSVTDTVSYSDVTPGKTYKVTGTLVRKSFLEDGTACESEFLDADGNAVTAEAEFTPKDSYGTVDVTFNFDASGVEDGTELVAFESLSLKGAELAAHADIDDESQTVTVKVPEVHTTAADKADGDKDVVSDPAATVTDVVEYSGVTPGKTYKVSGKLMEKVVDANGLVSERELTDAEGNPVTATTEFTPKDTYGSVELTFSFDASLVPDETEVVAFEDLIHNGKVIAVHADINDEDQTVEFHTPKVATTATDSVDGDKFVVTDAEDAIDDEVAYDGVAAGEDYTLVGILMDKQTGLPVLTGESKDKFTSDDLEKFVAGLMEAMGIEPEVTVTVDGERFGEGADLTRGEDGSWNYVTEGKTVAEDGSWTSFRRVRALTPAEDGTWVLTGTDEGASGEPDGPAQSFIYMIEPVTYEADQVVVSESYGWPAGEVAATKVDMDKLSGFCEANSELIASLVHTEAELTPEKASGSATVRLAFDGRDVVDPLTGEPTDVVAFELLLRGSLEDAKAGKGDVYVAAAHADIDDEGQTVTVSPSSISTTATDKSDGDHELMAGKDATVTDEVAYTGLIPGKEYKLTATLMDKQTGEPLSVNDKHVTAELRFTPNSADGTVSIDLGAFDATELDGHTLVVFEELSKQATVGDKTDEVTVAVHKDIDDEDQSVTVTSTPKGTTYGFTGIDSTGVACAVALLAALAAGLAAYAHRAKRAEDAKAE